MSVRGVRWALVIAAVAAGVGVLVAEPWGERQHAARADAGEGSASSSAVAALVATASSSTAAPPNSPSVERRSAAVFDATHGDLADAARALRGVVVSEEAWRRRDGAPREGVVVRLTPEFAFAQIWLHLEPLDGQDGTTWRAYADADGIAEFEPRIELASRVSLSSSRWIGPAAEFGTVGPSTSPILLDARPHVAVATLAVGAEPGGAGLEHVEVTPFEEDGPTWEAYELFPPEEPAVVHFAAPAIVVDITEPSYRPQRVEFTGGLYDVRLVPAIPVEIVIEGLETIEPPFVYPVTFDHASGVATALWLDSPSGTVHLSVAGEWVARLPELPPTMGTVSMTNAHFHVPDSLDPVTITLRPAWRTDRPAADGH